MKNKQSLVGSVLAGLFIILLIYTRTANLGWGLPYAMHPDERNMAVAIMQLKCEKLDLVECMNPHFFAYGQLPLYIAWGLAKIHNFAVGNSGSDILFDEATMSLRWIASAAAIFGGWILFTFFGLMAGRLFPQKPAHKGAKASKESTGLEKFAVVDIYNTRVILLISLFFIFLPGFIQFGRYGTTESMLMTLYIGILYLSVKVLYKQFPRFWYGVLAGALCGVAIATKVSALPYLAIPAVTLLASSVFHLNLRSFKKNLKKNSVELFWLVISGFTCLGIAAFFAIVLSPYNIIGIQDFRGSMTYESGVGLGTMLVFYTRQFFMTVPGVFQVSNILPFVLGLPIFVLFVLGLVILPWRKDINLLRLSFLMIFIPNAFFYAKWTRFIAPIFPVMVLIAALCLYYLYRLALAFVQKRLAGRKHERLAIRGVRVLAAGIILISILPGIAYFNVYLKQDVRFTASQWVYDNIQEGSYFLAETANVIDVPIPPPPLTVPPKSYTYISFDFYHINENAMLYDELGDHITFSDYIFVPSRRVFKNHTCLVPKEFPSTNEPKALIRIDQRINLDALTPVDERCQKLAADYPQLHDYYTRLFDGSLGYQQVAEFTSYPDITIFGKRIIEFPDENAEETWTVFDHPVFRIYKKVETVNSSSN